MALFRKCCESIVSKEEVNQLIDFVPSIVALAAIAFSVYQLYINHRQNRKEKRRNEIYKKLNGFYGSFLHLRKRVIYCIKNFKKNIGRKILILELFNIC